MKEIKTDFDKRLIKNIIKIKQAVIELEREGLHLYIDKNVETLYGALVDNVYIRDCLGKSVILQKHLFTVKGEK
jgi:hypothetical protein